MPSSCEFYFNKPEAIYYSGETVSGNIILNTSKIKNVGDVSILFLGEGRVKWTEGNTNSNHMGGTEIHDTIYTSHESYIYNSTLVYGDGILPIGRHIFTFNIPLPLECPSSLESEYGHIRYEIILKINRYYTFDNVFKKSVNVIKRVDLNFYPGYKIPVSMDSISNICCWPCSKGKILMNLTIPFGAYVPDQIIKYTLNIQNHSSSDIESFSIQLLKKITFTARTPYHKTRITSNILNSRTCLEHCLRQSNRIINGELYIPSTSPTTYVNDIMYVEYTLNVTLKISDCCSVPHITVPIIIGTIPITESLANNQQLSYANQQQVGAVVSRNIPVNNFASTNNHFEIIEPNSQQQTGVVSGNDFGTMNHFEIKPVVAVAGENEKAIGEKYSFNNDLKPPSYEESTDDFKPYNM